MRHFKCLASVSPLVYCLKGVSRETFKIMKRGGHEARHALLATIIEVRHECD